MQVVSCTHSLLAFFYFILYFIWGVSITNPMLVLLFIGRISLTHLVLASFLSGEFLLHIPCWHHFSVGSFSYTSHAGFIFIWGVSLTHPILGSFFLWGVSLTHPMQGFFCFVFWFFLKIYGVSLTHPMLASVVFFMWGASLECSLLWRQPLKKRAGQPLKKRAGWKMAQIFLIL